MNRIEADNLTREAEKLMGRTLTVRQEEPGGRKVEREYALTSVHGIGFGKIRAVEEPADENDMFYHLSAVLEEVDGRRRLDRLPLRRVLKALEEGAVLDLTTFP